MSEQNFHVEVDHAILCPVQQFCNIIQLLGSLKLDF